MTRKYLKEEWRPLQPENCWNKMRFELYIKQMDIEVTRRSEPELVTRNCEEV